MEDGRLATVKCPVCQGTFGATLRIKVSVPEKQEGRLVPAGKEDFYRTQGFNCPGCKHVIQLRLAVRILSVEKPERDVLSPDNLFLFSETEVALLEEVKKSGVLDAFTEVVCEVRRGMKQEPPKRMDRFFLSFLETAQRKILPREILDRFIAENPGAQIDLWHAQGFGMILWDGIIHRFIPMKSLHADPGGKRGEKLVIGDMQIQRRDLNNVEGLMRRGRFGYVPAGSNVFLASLMHSLGHRGRDMPNVSIRRKR